MFPASFEAAFCPEWAAEWLAADPDHLYLLESHKSISKAPTTSKVELQVGPKVPGINGGFYVEFQFQSFRVSRKGQGFLL